MAAANYIRSLCDGKTIINIDETILQSTDNRHYSWVPRGSCNVSTLGKRMSKVSITAAVSNGGQMYFTVAHGITNSHTFAMFLSQLVLHLD